MSADVKLFKLATGQYVVAQVQFVPETLNEDVLVKFGVDTSSIAPPMKRVIVNPIEVVPSMKEMRRQSGETVAGMGIDLVPFVWFTDEKTFELPDHWVLIETLPEPALLNAYNAQFGSGIIVPSSKLVTP